MLSVIIGFGFVFGAIAVALAAYFMSRLFFGGLIESETQRLAGSVMTKCASLHALILALVFAQEIFTYQDVREQLVAEATAVGDIYFDVRRYGTDSEARIQADLSQYVHLVVEKEWDILAMTGKLSQDAWRMRDNVYLAVLDLEPETGRQETLRQHMLQKIQFLAESRHSRANTAQQGIGEVFWFASVFGLVIVAMSYFGFTPNRRRLALLSLYAGFTGVIMFMTFALANPFDDPGRLGPHAFERLLATEIGRPAGGGRT